MRNVSVYICVCQGIGAGCFWIGCLFRTLGSRRLTRIIKGLPKSVRQRQRSCLFGRDLRSLWQTDFATPEHWIPGQASLPGMTRYLVWGGLFLLSEHYFTNGLSQSISCRSCRSCYPRSISFPLIVAPIYMGAGHHLHHPPKSGSSGSHP